MATIAELENQLVEQRPSMTLHERVELRAEIDRLSGVEYGELSGRQVQRLARIAGPGLRRIAA